MYDGANTFTPSHLTQPITLTAGSDISTIGTINIGGGTLQCIDLNNNKGGLIQVGPGILNLGNGTTSGTTTITLTGGTLQGSTTFTGSTLNIGGGSCGVVSFSNPGNMTLNLANTTGGTINVNGTNTTQQIVCISGIDALSLGSGTTLTVNSGDSTSVVLAVDSSGATLSIAGPDGTITPDQNDTLAVSDPLGLGPLPASPAPLTYSDLLPIVVEAKNRVTAALGASAAQNLSGVSFELADLLGGVLAETSGRTIRIDRHAAGFGWFADSTPQDDLEFSGLLGHNALQASSPSPAVQRADLLAAVMHEMGHELGLAPSTDPTWMESVLPVGVRRLPSA
jgi:hypothetical protein